MTSFLLVFNPSTDSLLRPVQLKTNDFRLTKNSGKVDLLKIDITFIEISKEWKRPPQQNTGFIRVLLKTCIGKHYLNIFNATD